MLIKTPAQNILITVLTALTLFGAQVSVAAPLRSCALVFTRVLTVRKAATERSKAAQAQVAAHAEPAAEGIGPIYGQMLPGFKHNDHYSNLAGDQSPIKNQCNLGTCHLYSWGSELEQEYKTRTGEAVKISMSYLAAKYWLRRSLEEVAKDSSPEDGEGQLRVSLGSFPLLSRAYILDSGIVPDSAWRAKVDFTKPPYSTRLEEYIENVIGQVRVARMQAMYKEDKLKITQAGMLQIASIFDNVIGSFPDKFQYDGHEFDPKTFMDEKFPELTQPLVTMAILPDSPDSKTKVKESEFSTDASANVVIVEKMMRDLIDQGHNVYLAYQHEAAYVDMKTGMMSISAYNIPALGRPLPAAYRNFFGKNDGGHAVQIVGYDLDPATGQVIKWKIKNSWGNKVGSRGFFHMYADYFRTFARAVYFTRDLGIKLPANEVHEQEQLDFNFGTPKKI